MTLLDNLYKQGVISKKVFALHLSSYGENTEDLSSISFGSWDTAKYAAGLDFTYVPIDPEYGKCAALVTNFSVVGHR